MEVNHCQTITLTATVWWLFYAITLTDTKGFTYADINYAV